MNMGRYKILDKLAQGAIATIYRAYDPKKNCTVVLKTINPNRVRAEEMNKHRQRFFREAQAVGELTHPGIVTIFDVGEDEKTGTPYLVMEYIKGRTLEELGRSRQLPLETVLDLVMQVAKALNYLHRQGIVHCDIKPANIIVTPEGRAKLIDFDIPKQTETHVMQPVAQVLGKLADMAPEQLTGTALDGRRDFFSLGVILYWLLTVSGKNVQTADPTPPPASDVRRADKRRATQARYDFSEKGQARHRRYNSSEKGRARQQRYRQKFI